MSDDELEAIKRRKMEELLQQQQSEGAQAAEMDAQKAEYEAQKAAILRQILTPEARERLARIRLARPDVVDSVEQQLISLSQSGRIQQKIDDDALRELLDRILPQKREIKIERR